MSEMGDNMSCHMSCRDQSGEVAGRVQTQPEAVAEARRVTA
jgi:hypothetical protein